MNIISDNHYDLKRKKDFFLSQKPFPHIHLRNFFKEDFFKNFSTSQIDIKKEEKNLFTTEFENKKWISKNTDLPVLTKKIIEELNSQLWINNLKELTGIGALIGTKVGNTKLANYHEMQAGGLLSPHVDHSSDPETGFPHVLNIVVYLTDSWKMEWGGGTDLLDSKGKKIKKNYPTYQIQQLFFYIPLIVFTAYQKYQKRPIKLESQFM